VSLDEFQHSGNRFPDDREARLKSLWRRYLPFALSAAFVLVLVSGCKPRGSLDTLPTATSDSVQLTLQNAKLGVNEPIGVLVKNTGTTDVFAIDGQAACTILGMQQYSSQQNAWTPVDVCHDTAQPHVVIIRAGMSEPFTLPPVSANDPNAWASGTYRIALTFSPSPDGKTSAKVAYSEAFVISGS
jgi:hypothetical protein